MGISFGGLDGIQFHMDAVRGGDFIRCVLPIEWGAMWDAKWDVDDRDGWVGEDYMFSAGCDIYGIRRGVG